MKKKIVGFTAGSFDLTHSGHFLMFKEVKHKHKCDFLIVGLQSDPSINRSDKNIPIQSVKERLIQLEACRYVDEICTYETEKDLLNLLINLSNKYKDNFIRFLGMDWKEKNYTGRELKQVKIIFNSRNHNYSTTNLRKRIYEAEKNIIR